MPVFVFLMLSAKQANYWCRFITPFGGTGFMAKQHRVE